MDKAIYMSMCEDCAGIMRQTRTIVETSKPYAGYCRLCYGLRPLIQYDVGMTHSEIARKRAREKAAAANGGGERARAGGRRRA